MHPGYHRRKADARSWAARRRLALGEPLRFGARDGARRARQGSCRHDSVFFRRFLWLHAQKENECACTISKLTHVHLDPGVELHARFRQVWRSCEKRFDATRRTRTRRSSQAQARSTRSTSPVHHSATPIEHMSACTQRTNCSPASLDPLLTERFCPLVAGSLARADNERAGVVRR